jgi:hypothetical protein
MGSEIPRDADLRDHCDEDERDQGDEQSDGARPGVDLAPIDAESPGTLRLTPGR